MRVVHAVRSDAFAGVERYISLVAPELARRGVDVEVIGGAPARMQEALGDVDWRPAATTGDVVAALRRGGRADLVHVHMTAAETAAVLTRPWHRGRVVATRHFAGPRGSTALRRLLLAPVGWGVAAEIAISAYVAGAVGGHPRVLLNGVPAPDDVAGPRQPVVVVAQRLEPEKQTRVAIDAFDRSGLAGHGWRLLVVGGGSQLEAVRASVRGRPDVTVSGPLASVDDVLGTAGMLLAPTPIEGFGFTLVEAMAHGTPVVAADGGAHRETLGDDAVFFPPGDVEAAAAALSSLAGDPAGRASYGERLQARHRALLTVDRHVDGLLRIYAEVLGAA